MSSRLLGRAVNLASRSEPVPGGKTEFQSYPALPGVLRAAPSVPLNASTVAALAAELGASLALDDSPNASRARQSYLLLDFTRVEDIDSAGLGLLVAFQKRLRAIAGDLVLCSLRPKLARFLETTGFADYFSEAVDARYALEYIQGMNRGPYPISASCPACSSTIGIREPGRGRCAFCEAVLTASPDGTVRAV